MAPRLLGPDMGDHAVRMTGVFSASATIPRFDPENDVGGSQLHFQPLAGPSGQQCAGRRRELEGAANDCHPTMVACHEQFCGIIGRRASEVGAATRTISSNERAVVTNVTIAV